MIEGHDRDNLDNPARQQEDSILKNYYWSRLKSPIVSLLLRFSVTHAVLYAVLSFIKKRRETAFLKNFSSASPGTAPWLVRTEIKYGGWTTVSINAHSPQSLRSHDRCNLGGDRMLHHGYAEKYAEYLSRYVRKSDAVTLAEFGILKGTGLAIWSELFPNGRILGFDIDLENARGNMDFLRERGAFREGLPELHEYDQFNDNTEYLGRVLGDTRLDIVIDDGFHSPESIQMTMRSVMPYLADRFVYFVEDNPVVHEEIRALYPHLKVDSAEQLTIISREDVISPA